MLRLEINIATIAATLPALRPLWTKSARRNLKNRRQTRRPEVKMRLIPTYVVRDPNLEADSSTSRLETRVIAQGDENQEGFRNEATPLPSCTRNPDTSDVGVENFQKVEGKWVPEYSSHSDRERSVENIV